MDNERFDALARVFAGRGTRRSVAAAALAALAGRAAIPALAQQNGEGDDCLRPGSRCDNNPTMWWRNNSCKLCCSGFPEPDGDGWACGCTPKGGGCGNSAGCCRDEECYYGVCGGPSCMPDGGECAANGIACCEGLYCDPYGWCKPDPNYVAPEPTAAPAPAAPEAPAADPGTEPTDVSLDTSTSNSNLDGTGDATESADAGSDTATDTSTGGSTGAGDASAGASGERECRPAGRGCTLPEQCCSGSCGVDGACV